ncbi:MAG: hypothetical protein NVSMB6_09940 [Burkholderiaceae bacterium]
MPYHQPARHHSARARVLPGYRRTYDLGVWPVAVDTIGGSPAYDESVAMNPDVHTLKNLALELSFPQMRIEPIRVGTLMPTRNMLIVQMHSA